jgi:hypothetical protein
MDPQVTWQELLDAWRRGDWNVVAEVADALLEWIRKSGFPPETMGSDMGSDWNRTVAVAAAQFALRCAIEVRLCQYKVPFDVPVNIVCSQCSRGGPTDVRQALAGGWTGLRYTPGSTCERFVACCPACRSADDARSSTT